MIQKIWIGIVLYSFYYAQVTTAKVQTAKAQIFVDPSNNLTCPPSDYSELTIHASFFSQASMIIVYGGVIFNIAVYGVKSSFSSITTFLLDDISIFALSFTPIISWYFVAKPIYLRGHEQLDILIIFGTIFLILFLFITYLLILYNWPCHRGHYWKKQRRFFFTKKSLCWIKYIIVHTYLIHSILIIFYDIITSPTSYEKYHVKAFIDFQILNFFTDFVYFCLSSFLIFEFHHKKLVHKRVFFFTVFLSVIQILFEYALVCSPNYVDTIFTFFLTTILTRSLASFFSENKKTVKIYGTDVSLIYKKQKKNGKDKDETKLNELETSMEYNGIRLIFNYGNNVKKDLELYGAKITLTDESDESDVISNNNTTDEKILVNPVNITLVYENDEIKEPAELDITGKIIKFKVIDGFGFLNYIITNYNRQKQN